MFQPPTQSETRAFEAGASAEELFAVRGDERFAEGIRLKGELYRMDDAFRVLWDAWETYRHPTACAALACMYKTGEGVQSAGIVSMEMMSQKLWHDCMSGLEERAARGEPHALYYMGVAYLDGHSQTPDKHRAFDYFQRAAEAGHVEAMYSCGEAYLYGHGIGMSRARACEWWRRAAEHGYAPAKWRIEEQEEQGCTGKLCAMCAVM